MCRSFYWSLSSLALYVVLFCAIFYPKINCNYEKYLIAFIGIINFILPFVVVIMENCFGKFTDTLTIKSIKKMENNLIPIYIGYSVLAISIGDFYVFFVVYIVLFILLYSSKQYYFHHALLFCGYSCYEMEDLDGNKITIITKKKDLKPQSSDCESFQNLKRLNNFVFLEKGDKT